MSWSVSRLGRASAVREALAADFAKAVGYLQEPEKTACAKIGEAIDAALGSYPQNVAVNVSASGSMYTPDSSKPEEKQHSMSLSFTTLGTLL